MELWRAINGPRGALQSTQAIQALRVVPMVFPVWSLISWGKIPSSEKEAKEKKQTKSLTDPPRVQEMWASSRTGHWAPLFAESRFRQRQPSGLVTTLPGRLYV